MSKPSIAFVAVGLSVLGACASPLNPVPEPPFAAASQPDIFAALQAKTAPSAKEIVQKVISKIIDKKIIPDTHVTDVTCTLHSATVTLGNKNRLFKFGYDGGADQTWRWVTVMLTGKVIYSANEPERGAWDKLNKFKNLDYKQQLKLAADQILDLFNLDKDPSPNKNPLKCNVDSKKLQILAAD